MIKLFKNKFKKEIRQISFFSLFMKYVTTAKPKYIKVQNDKEESYFVSQVTLLIEDYIHSDEFVFLSYIAWE